MKGAGFTLWCRGVFLSTLILTFYLAVTPRHIPLVSDIYDKLEHLAAFLVLAFLLDLSFPKSRFHVKKFLFLFGYGLFIEVVQYFLPFRDASLWDLVADTLGITLYWLSSPLFKRLPVFKLASNSRLTHEQAARTPGR